MIRYDPHAEFQLVRRRIEKGWIEAVLSAPDETEQQGSKLSLLACFPERGKMLRVVVRRDDPEYVITAYFDRRKPCA
ncbi:MAG: DUF4258 domain-containing protein [Nitrospirae bacterium]|nr:DUF4258 domain-containing protein [Magnetococcales bacterium]HAT49913.1 hypothetical protein [Alphaproteobacteria bacterium]